MSEQLDALQRLVAGLGLPDRSRSAADRVLLRDAIICGSEELLMRALESAGVKRVEGQKPFGGVRIYEDPFFPRDKAVLIDGEGKCVAVFTLPTEAP